MGILGSEAGGAGRRPEKGSQGPQKQTPGLSWSLSALVSQEHGGAPLSERASLECPESGQMCDGLPGQRSSPTHRAAFHPRPGKDKKLSCKFCSLTVTTSTHACGPHCAASPGRSLALRAVWHPQPSLAPCRPPCRSAPGACIPEPDSGSPALPKDAWGAGEGREDLSRPSSLIN